ncbi:hypothetical protein NKI56_24830 [Mesorhizobium sp. M0622]|uniref:hypothetical protein n=1 Tax=unclassified Mesorhizobium TaxID=325217 RepID=UPI00333AC3AB
MATAVQKITLSSSRDIPFKKVVLSQSKVRRVKAGIWIGDLPDLVAEVATRSRLIVRKTSSGGIDRLVAESRAGSANLAEPQAPGSAILAKLLERYPVQRIDMREYA